MTERADVTVMWGVFSRTSPRIVEVDLPSLELLVQDMVDTLRSNTLIGGESNLQNIDKDFILDAVGKVQLGGGVLGGITATLYNAKLRFCPRAGPATVLAEVLAGNVVTFLQDAGEHTGGDSNTLLVDSVGGYQSFGLQQGFDVFNKTDGSSAVVVSVDSETGITTDGLTGGSDNLFQAGDVISVEGYVNPLSPSAFVTISRTGDTSAALLDPSLSSVWDVPIADHEIPGSFGERVGKKLLDFVRFISNN
jgi:hypothetical protein